MSAHTLSPLLLRTHAPTIHSYFLEQKETAKVQMESTAHPSINPFSSHPSFAALVALAFASSRPITRSSSAFNAGVSRPCVHRDPLSPNSPRRGRRPRRRKSLTSSWFMGVKPTGSVG